MTHALWTFSLSRYDRSGVSECCLALQDDIGADVNVMLFLLWAGHITKRITPQVALPAIHDATFDWHDTVVRPLRAARRAAKSRATDDAGAIVAMRERLKAIEIEVERLEQDMLFNLAHDPPVGFWYPHDDKRAAMQSNLADYLASIGMSRPVCPDLVETLVARCV